MHDFAIFFVAFLGGFTGVVVVLGYAAWKMFSMFDPG